MFYYSALRKEHMLAIKIQGTVFQIKGPKARALFSERYGYNKALFKIRGWRFFFGRKQRRLS